MHKIRWWIYHAGPLVDDAAYDSALNPNAMGHSVGDDVVVRSLASVALYGLAVAALNLQNNTKSHLVNKISPKIYPNNCDDCTTANYVYATYRAVLAVDVAAAAEPAIDIFD